MSKYSVGDKFVIEIGEVFTGNFSVKENTLYRVKGFRSLVFDKTGLDNLERLDGDYVNENFGELQNESYEVGRKVGQEEAIKWSRQNEMDMYNAGLNDAWELARKIVLDEIDGGMSVKDFYNIFDKTMGDEDVLKKFTPKEVIAKLEAYEKSKDEIKVGDVVDTKNEFQGIGVVTYLENNWANLVHNDGLFSTGVPTDTLTKTGKHINISALLEEIGEE